MEKKNVKPNTASSVVTNRRCLEGCLIDPKTGKRTAVLVKFGGEA